MIAICIPITSWEDYERFALPGIRRVQAAAPETLVIPRDSVGSSYQRTVNALLDEVAHRSDLDATVLIHQDTELLNANAATILPERFVDPRLAIVGSVGARFRSGLIWNAAEPRGSRIELPDGYEGVDLHSGYSIVASVDGVLIAMSPWAVRNLRFDLRFERWFHGYDVDISLQARAHGRLVAVDDIPIRHHQIDGYRNGRGAEWIEAEMEIRRKWDIGRPPGGLSWARGPAPAQHFFG
jgi:hypothetical protein